VRVARALAGLPQTSAAMSQGELSFSQVRALTRVADAECEAELLEHARTMTAAELEKFCRAWKKLGRDEEAKLEERIHRSRSVSVFPDDEGGYVIRGRLEPEVGALVMRAIEAASDALYRGSVPETTPEQRRADALALLAERALAAGFEGGVDEACGGDEGGEPADPAQDEVGVEDRERRGAPGCESHESPEGEGGRDGREPGPSAETRSERRSAPSSISGTRAERRSAPSSISGTRAERYMVVLHVDDATLSKDGDGERSHLEDGTRVSAEGARRLACDASVVRVRHTRGKDGAPVLEVEGKTRTVPPRLRRALEIRDRGCRFPGCGSRFTEAHHIHHWTAGGPTRIDNLVLLCRTHHHLLHEGGFRLEPDPARLGRPIFYSPRGICIPKVPPRMTIAGMPVGRRGSAGAAELASGERAGAGAAGLGSGEAAAATGHRPRRRPRWEEDVPLAFYLRALEAIG
jgi:hypothetical protein